MFNIITAFNKRNLTKNLVVLYRELFTDNKNQSDVKITEISDVKSFDSIPGPTPVPIFGFLWHSFPIVGKYVGLPPHFLHIRLNKEYGNLVRLRELKFSKDLVLCYDPKDIETVFRNDGQWPKRSILPTLKHYREEMRKDIFQGYGGVFTCDDKEWQDARSVANSILMQPRIAKHLIKPFSDVADDFVKRIRVLAAQNDRQEMPDDFQRELMKLVLESIGVLATDSRFGLLDPNVTENQDKLEYIDNVSKFFDLLYKIEVLPSLSKYITTSTWKEYISVMDAITCFVLKHVEMSKKIIEKEGKLNKDINDMSVIEKLLKNYDKKYLLGNVLDVLLGGVDTTSRAIAGILYLMSTHPEAQEKLRKEVNDVLPNNDDTLTTEKLENMPYLRAVIKESFRLIPIVLGLTRINNKDLVLSGYHIPKGTTLILEQIPLLWDDNNFPESDKFKPERWLRKDRKPINISPWINLQFGFGPRSCVGQRVAQLELEILLVKMIQNFKMEWHHDPVKFDFKLMLKIDSPLKIRMIATK